MIKTLDIERLSHDGRGISRINGKTAFVELALPQEGVRAQLIKSHRRFDEYRCLEVETPSPDRVTPPCSHYQHCGGCQLQHLSPEGQRQHKQAAAIELIERSSGLNPQHITTPVFSNHQGYRARARLAVWYHNRDKQYRIGFRAANSKQIIDIDSCFILHPELNRLLPLLPELCKNLKLGKALGHIDLLLHEIDENTVQAALSLRVLSTFNKQQQVTLEDFSKEQNCLIRIDDDRQLSPQKLQYHLPKQTIKLQFGWSDFTQANRGLNRDMVSSAIEQLQLKAEDHVLDAFCGMGNFSLGIAQQAQHVIAVEGSEDMVKVGQTNADDNHIDNIDFIQRNLMNADSLKRLAKMTFNKALIDPPRDGALVLCEMLCKHRVERLVYVSCNPASLARDAKVLAAGKYQLETLYINDMFPHSSHSEVTACFVQVKKGKA